MQVLRTHVMKVSSTGRQGSEKYLEKGRITKLYIKLNFSAALLVRDQFLRQTPK